MYKKSEHWFSATLEDFDTSKWRGYLRVKKSGAFRLNLSIGLHDFKTLHTVFEEKQILNGYLEQQNPICLLKPYFVSYGFNTYEIHAQYLLEGVHLAHADETCFTGFTLASNALHAVVNPKMIEVDYEPSDNKLTPKIDFLPDQDTTFVTKNGTEVAIYSGANIVWRAYDVPKIKSGSHLEIKFPQPINHHDAETYISKVHFFFCFLSGKQLKIARYKLFTNKQRENDRELEFITASPIYKSSLRDCPLRMGNRRSFIELTETKVSIEQIFEQVSADEDRSLTYLMDMILRSERSKGALDDRFIELIGLLENFHKLKFESGINKKETKANKQRKRPKNMILVQRLEQLAEDWKQDGFRGYPDFGKIKALRNFKPHGRGVDLSHDDFQYIAVVLPFLSALIRYHVLKTIGFDRKEIAHSFMAVAHLYGRFIPAEFIPR